MQIAAEVRPIIWHLPDSGYRDLMSRVEYQISEQDALAQGHSVTVS